MPVAGHWLPATGPAANRQGRARQRTPQQFEMLDVSIEGLFLLCGCNDICNEVSIRFCTKWVPLVKPAQSENSTRIFNFTNKVWSSWEFFQDWIMLLTFTIHSSVVIQDSYFDERFQLRLALLSIRALCFHTCFGPRQALRALIQFLGELRTWSFKVFNCLGLRLRALTRASGFHVRFGWCHQHWLGRSGTVSVRWHYKDIQRARKCGWSWLHGAPAAVSVSSGKEEASLVCIQCIWNFNWTVSRQRIADKYLLVVLLSASECFMYMNSLKPNSGMNLFLKYEYWTRNN